MSSFPGNSKMVKVGFNFVDPQLRACGASDRCGRANTVGHCCRAVEEMSTMIRVQSER